MADEPRPDPDPVMAYYVQKREEFSAAYRALQEARKQGAPPEEIRRLEKVMDRAAYVGD